MTNTVKYVSEAEYQATVSGLQQRLWLSEQLAAYKKDCREGRINHDLKTKVAYQRELQARIDATYNA